MPCSPFCVLVIFQVGADVLAQSGLVRDSSPHSSMARVTGICHCIEIGSH
jgi:hypothetical protein